MRRLGRALGVAAVAGWLGVLLLVVLSVSCGHQYFLTGTKVTPTPGPSSSSTATAGPTATPTQGLVFATNNGDGQLSEFSRDLTSGALTLIGTTAVGAVSGPTGLALSPSNGFLYVANSADHLIREFSVDTSTGALAGIGSVSDGAGSSPQRIAIDSSGSFLYVTKAPGPRSRSTRLLPTARSLPTDRSPTPGSSCSRWESRRRRAGARCTSLISVPGW